MPCPYTKFEGDLTRRTPHSNLECFESIVVTPWEETAVRSLRLLPGIEEI
jgi:hypothetical protein